VLDIYYSTNEIAVKNGYSPLDEKGLPRRDPNLIFPGRTFVLPNGTEYVVKLYDTMWGISTGYIRQNILGLCQAYEDLVKPYRPGKVPANKKEEVSGEIRNLISRCKSENLRRVFEEKIRNL
jgi:hypothetical protein